MMTTKQLDGNTFLDKYPLPIQCGLCKRLKYTGGERGMKCPIYGDFQRSKTAQLYWLSTEVCPNFNPIRDKA